MPLSCYLDELLCMGRPQDFPRTPTVPAAVSVIWCVWDYHSVEEQAKVAESLEFGFGGGLSGLGSLQPRSCTGRCAS